MNGRSTPRLNILDWFALASARPRGALVGRLVALALGLASIAMYRAHANDLGGSVHRAAIAIPFAWAAFIALAPAVVRGRLLARLVDELDARPTAALLGACALAALTYGVLLTDAVGPVDSALYTNQIAKRDTIERAIHWGYFVYSIGVSKLIAVPVNWAANIAVALAGVIATGGAFLALMTFPGAAASAVAAVSVALGLSAIFVFDSLYANSYIVQAAAGFLSLWLYRRQKSLLGGAMYGYTLTVSVASMYLAPLFLLPDPSMDEASPWSPPRLRKLLTAIAGAVAFYGLFLLFHWKSLFYGDRGLLVLGMEEVREGGSMVPGLKSSLKQLVGSFPVILPMSLAALASLRNVPARWWAPFAATIILYLLTAGGAAVWGFLLPVLPVVMVPLLRWCWDPRPQPSERRRRTAVLWLGVICNVAATLWIWLPTDQFRGPVRATQAFREMSAQVGPDVTPVGDDSLRYLRANRRPFLSDLPPQIDPVHGGTYLVLDAPTLDSCRARLTSEPVAVVADNGVRAWLVHVAPSAKPVERAP
jgi:hypothetical protein